MKISSHLKAVLTALFVTVLWSSSWVLIKYGLEDIPPLPFAGLRYTLAFLCLLPFAARAGALAELRGATRRTWAGLIGLGLLLYAVAQGAMYVALNYLPAVSVSLMLSFTAVLVTLMGITLLGERPTLWQWTGTVFYLSGVVVYFYPLEIPQAGWLGLGAALLGMLANSISTVIGRGVNRSGKLSPLAVTTASMGIGSLVLLGGGVAAQGMPMLSAGNWAAIGWLAVVNSALAFTLWNRTQKVLTAMESSLLNNTMLFQIAILAWIFLGEAMSARQIVGMVVAGAGTFLVQIRKEETMQGQPQITLRALEEADLPVLFEQQLDPEANRMAAFTSQDPGDREAFMAHWGRIMADTNTLIRAIIYEGQVAGSVLSYLDGGKPEVSYWLGKEYWGRGIATRALEEFLEKVNSARPIYGRVAKDNLGSRRVLEKCGFTVIDEAKGYANARGEEIEELVLEKS